ELLRFFLGQNGLVCILLAALERRERRAVPDTLQIGLAIGGAGQSPGLLRGRGLGRGRLPLANKWNRGQHQDGRRIRGNRLYIKTTETHANFLSSRFLRGIRSIAAGSDEELLAVGERDVAPIRPIAAVLGAIALDHHRCSFWQSVAGEAATEQGIRTAT